MRSSAVLCALAIVAVMTGKVHAQSGEGSVPTVTIINSSPDVPEAGPQELTVTPGKPREVAEPEAKALEVAPSPPPSEPTEQPSGPAAAAAGDAGKPVEAQPAAPAMTPTLAINIDLSRQMMAVSENGVPRHSWQISSARYGYHTPIGTYQPTWMSKMWYSRQYDYAPMPHAIFFHQGVAIHATYATRALGRPASHGCVRLAPKNAALLFKLVNQHGKERTQIVVHGRPDHSTEVAEGMPDARRVEGTAPQQLRRGAPAYRYLPPSYYARGSQAYYSDTPRTRRTGGSARRPPRGLYSYGYGF
jgi:lipoprotein-anchoring transpeptidase ErfK/SrfK